MRSSQNKAPAPSSAIATPARWLWVLLAAVSGTAYMTFYLRPGLFWWFGVQHYDIWFADILAVLSSNDAVTQGLNPYAPNPLDFFNRPHVYSHWWLELRHLGLTRADLSWLGPTIVIASWLAALRWLRPSNLRQVGFALAVLISPPVLLALERANNDLVIFLLLTPLVSCLQSGRRWVRWIAPVLVAMAAGLKYYPAVAAILLLADAPPREARWRLIIGAALLLGTALSVAPDLAMFGGLAPHPSGWLSFGAREVFNEPGAIGWACAGLSVIIALTVAAWAWRATAAAEWIASLDSSGDWLRFLLGAAMLTGCFLTSANFAYRWFFALWLVPFLWPPAAAAAAPPSVAKLARVTAWLLLAALWLDVVFTWLLLASLKTAGTNALRQWIRWTFWAEQPLTWALFACLAVFLARFLFHRWRAFPLARARSAA